MRKLSAGLLLALLALLPAAVSAQGIGVGAKIGTLGYGVDGALGLNDRLTVRAGIAFSPEELPFADALIDGEDITGLDYTILVPTTTFQAGVDFRLIGPLKLIGGAIYRTEDLAFRADVDGDFELGGQIFNTGQPGTVTASLAQADLLPYAGIGIGGLVGSGIGIYLDVALAFSSDADVVVTASDNLNSIPGLQQALQDEADAFLEDVPSFADNLYPVVQLGVRIGLGG